MVVDLKHVGTADWVRDKLKTSVNTSTSSVAHNLNPSFQGLVLLSTLTTCRHSESLVR